MSEIEVVQQELLQVRDQDNKLLQVLVILEKTPEGPRVRLAGLNCDLEGETPGAYYLVNGS